MLIGCINCYNDMPLIVQCIESIYSQVDRIIVVDGSYIDFPGSGSSTDGTIEFLDSIEKVQLITTIGLSEIQKRNKYLEPLSDGDIVINLDSDEVLVGNIPTLDCDFAIIDLKDGHSKHIQRRATRFFKFRIGMHYENVHYTLYWNGKIINKLHQVINKDFTFEYIKDFYMIHNWHLRDELRKHNKSIYYKKLVKLEAGFVK